MKGNSPKGENNTTTWKDRFKKIRTRLKIHKKTYINYMIFSSVILLEIIAILLFYLNNVLHLKRDCKKNCVNLFGDIIHKEVTWFFLQWTSPDKTDSLKILSRIARCFSFACVSMPAGRSSQQGLFCDRRPPTKTLSQLL